MDKEHNKLYNMSRRLGKYAASSALSAVVDIVLYSLLYHFAFQGLKPALHTLLAVSIARVCSSAVNYACNSKFVFRITNSSALCKYYILWFFQLASSFLLAHLTANIWDLNPTVSKLICDLILAILSYQLQRRWVFKPNNNPNGPLVSIIRFFVKLFAPRYQSFQPPRTEPCVYVCRHMCMHGPYTTLIWMKPQAHPMILDCFFNYDSCYVQYRDYTFPSRYRLPKFLTCTISKLFSLMVVPVIRSLHAIPVFRGGNKAITTLKNCQMVLSEGHSIIVYPDKNYAARGDTEDNIYDGFLYIDSMYYRKTGKHLDFVPLVIDDHNKTIRELDPVRFETRDFSAERGQVAAKIAAAIFGSH